MQATLSLLSMTMDITHAPQPSPFSHLIAITHNATHSPPPPPTTTHSISHHHTITLPLTPSHTITPARPVPHSPHTPARAPPQGSSPIPGRTAGAAHTTTASSAGFSVSGTKLSANLPPNTPANTSIPVASGAHTVDSNAYLRDVVNLSVDLDHDPSPPAAAEAASDLLMATSSSGEDEGEAQAGGKSECTALRASARALLTNLDPAAHIGERVHWMLVTAPDAPVAGEECALLFNRKQSDALRWVV